MCGRFAFYSPHESVVRLFPVDEAPPVLPRYNLAPTQFVATVLKRKDAAPALTMLRWGLIPFWAKDKAIGNRMINARAETVHGKPAFRAAFKKRRCLVLADGFYEWVKDADGKTPHYIYLRSREPFAMAGLWESWHDEAADKPLETCTIITTDPNDMMGALHNRMPVILARADHDAWIDPDNDDVEALRSLLVPFTAEDMAHHPVAKTVNNPRNDDETLIDAASA